MVISTMHGTKLGVDIVLHYPAFHFNPGRWKILVWNGRFHQYVYTWKTYYLRRKVRPTWKPNCSQICLTMSYHLCAQGTPCGFLAWDGSLDVGWSCVMQCADAHHQPNLLTFIYLPWFRWSSRRAAGWSISHICNLSGSTMGPCSNACNLSKKNYV